MDYDDYKLEDFLANPEFRNWVLNPTTSSHFFWKKWMDANPQKRDTALAARKIILSIEYRKVETIQDEEKDELLNRILSEKSNTKNKKTRKYRVYYSVAASIVLLVSSIVLYQLIHPETTEIHPPIVQITQIVKENHKGQKSRITLPDGSTVWLNSDSRITYVNKFVDTRNIVLEGEAFFEVKKDSLRPFIVHANGLLTKALGTSFNIRAYKNKKVEVGLVTGKIAVSLELDKENTKIIDAPMGKAVLDITNKEINISSYSDLDFYKWTDRILVFKAADFDEIKETLERWYDVDITIHNPKRKISYTGKFKKESLERILERMAFVEKFSFHIDETNERKINIYFE